MKKSSIYSLRKPTKKGLLKMPQNKRRNRTGPIKLGSARRAGSGTTGPDALLPHGISNISKQNRVQLDWAGAARRAGSGSVEPEGLLPQRFTNNQPSKQTQLDRAGAGLSSWLWPGRAIGASALDFAAAASQMTKYRDLARSSHARLVGLACARSILSSSALL